MELVVWALKVELYWKKSKLLTVCRKSRNHPYRLTTAINTHHYAEAFLPRCLPHPSSDACSSSASFSFWFELASTSDTDLGEGQDEAGNLPVGRGSTDEAPFLQLKPITKTNITKSDPWPKKNQSWCQVFNYQEVFRSALVKSCCPRFQGYPRLQASWVGTMKGNLSFA